MQTNGQLCHLAIDLIDIESSQRSGQQTQHVDIDMLVHQYIIPVGSLIKERPKLCIAQQ